MLKVEYPCRDILPSHKNQTKPVLTWAEAKKHLHDIRLRRQNQLTSEINECHRLRTIHKQAFNRQFDSTEKSVHINPDKSINNEYSSQTNQHSIPRIEYASVIYRQLIPTYEVETVDKLENDLPIVKELSQYLSESSDQIGTHQSLLPPVRKDRHSRRLSVSSVTSNDKRMNKVYEKWPDYSQISQIVGYRIDPPPSKIIPSNSTLCRPAGAMGQRKRNTSTGFTAASKQIKNMITLNMSPKASKTKKSVKTDSAPIIIDKPSSTNEKILPENPPIIKTIKPQLPSMLCPSSVMYSNRIQTRQWLLKHHFSSNAMRTLPLL